MVRDPGRIINNPLEIELIGVRGSVICDISAEKAFLGGVVNASGAPNGSFSERRIIILSASMTKVDSSCSLGRVSRHEAGQICWMF